MDIHSLTTLAQTQLFPTNYPYYYPDEHRAIYEALLAMHPAGLLTATSFSPDVAGAQYPLQMIEDGNFDIPSVYLLEQPGTPQPRDKHEIGAVRQY